MKAFLSSIKNTVAKHEHLLVALTLTVPLFQLTKWTLQEILALPLVRAIATHTPFAFVIALAAMVSLWPVSLRLIKAAHGRARDASGMTKRIAAHMAFFGALALGIWLAGTTFVIAWQPVNGLLGIHVEVPSAWAGLMLVGIGAIAAVVYLLANLIAGWVLCAVDRVGQDDRGFVLWMLMFAAVAYPCIDLFAKFYRWVVFA
jgi:hypothetical protein